MGSRPSEIDVKTTSTSELSSPLQKEADAARFGSHSGGGFGHSFEDVISDIPAPLAVGAGAVSGFLSRMPGPLGAAGKLLAGGEGLAYGGDLALRVSGLSNRQGATGAMVRDGLVLGAIGSGALAPNMIGRISQGLDQDSGFWASLDKLTNSGRTLGERDGFEGGAIPDWAKGTAYPGVRAEFLDEIQSFPEADQAKFKQALNMAEKAHMGQVRMAHLDNPGPQDPYIVHPVRAALILPKEAGVRAPDTIIATLLHDTVEDGGPEYLGSIREQFGDHVLSMVSAVSKPATEGGLSEAQAAEYFARLESSPADVKEVKLADRLQNIRDTVDLPDRNFQQRKLDETVEHYIPLARSPELADSTGPFFVREITKSSQDVAARLAGQT